MHRLVYQLIFIIYIGLLKQVLMLIKNIKKNIIASEMAQWGKVLDIKSDALSRRTKLTPTSCLLTCTSLLYDAHMQNKENTKAFST